MDSNDPPQPKHPPRGPQADALVSLPQRSTSTSVTNSEVDSASSELQALPYHKCNIILPATRQHDRIWNVDYGTTQFK